MTGERRSLTALRRLNVKGEVVAVEFYQDGKLLEVHNADGKTIWPPSREVDPRKFIQ